jgi:hypothetical protein
MRTTDEHINWTNRPDDSSNPYLTETVPAWGYGEIGVWLLLRLGLPLLLIGGFLDLAQPGDLTTSWAADVLLLVGSGLYLLAGVKEGSRRLLQRVAVWWVTRTEKQAASPAAADITIIELEMGSRFWSEGHPTGGRGCPGHGQNGQRGA